jgi:phosphoglycolate phosphatase-like HAD superfamily hydrolase
MCLGFELVSPRQEVAMSMETFLVRTMSDTVETDIQRVFTIANEILPRYEMPPLSLTELRKIADGPFDLFLIPLVFAKEYQKDRNLPFNEAKRVEIRTHALEIARKHGFDVNPPDFISEIEQSLKSTKEAGLRNVLMTTGGRRYKHQAMEKAGIGGYFDEIVDREETYYAKEQGLYYLYRKHKLPRLRIILFSGTATYIRAGNNAHGCKVGGSDLEVVTVALSTEHSYNDEETLRAAQPKILIRSLNELLPALKEQGLVN